MGKLIGYSESLASQYPFSHSEKCSKGIIRTQYTKADIITDWMNDGKKMHKKTNEV